MYYCSLFSTAFILTLVVASISHFSPLLQNFHVFFPRSRFFSFIRINVDIKIYLKGRLGFVVLFSLKVRGPCDLPPKRAGAVKCENSRRLT